MIRSLDWLANFLLVVIGIQILVTVLMAVLITSIMISFQN